MNVSKPEWSTDKLELSLRRWIKARHLTIQVRNFDPTDCSAMAFYDDADGRKRRFIKWDKDQVGRLNATIHELLEIHLDRELDRWGDLREAIVVAFEKEMVDRITSSPEKMNWWRKAMTEREA